MAQQEWMTIFRDRADGVLEIGMVSNLARDHTAHGYPDFASRLRSNYLTTVNLHSSRSLRFLAYGALSRDMRA